MQHARNFVDGVSVFQWNNRTLFHVGEQGDLLQRRRINFVVGTADQHIRLQTDGAHFFNRVLSRLGFGFTGGGNVRHQRQVQRQRTT